MSMLVYGVTARALKHLLKVDTAPADISHRWFNPKVPIVSDSGDEVVSRLTLLTVEQGLADHAESWSTTVIDSGFSCTLIHAEEDDVMKNQEWFSRLHKEITVIAAPDATSTSRQSVSMRRKLLKLLREPEDIFKAESERRKRSRFR